MSERPKTTGSPSRGSVWVKVGLVMVLPVAATVALVTNGLLDYGDTAKQAEQASALATVVQASGDLADLLQEERAAAAMLLASLDSPRQPGYRSTYDNARSAVTEAAGDYTARRTALGEVPTNVLTTLNRIDSGLRTLPDLRTAIGTDKVAFTDATRGYDAVVENLLQLRDNAAQVATDPALNQRMRAAAAIARGKEHLSQERVTVLQGYAAGALNPSLRTQFIAAQTGWTQAMETFSSNATEAEKNQFNDIVAGAKLRTATAFAGWVAVTMPAAGNLATAPFNIDTWNSALVGNGTLIRNVERQLDSAVVDAATTVRDDGKRQALVEAGVPLAILLLAILLAVFVARSMTRSRRDPSDDAVVADGPVDPDRPLATTASGTRS
jgi:hypothetical protein